jgi:hypothetical protein
MAARCSGRSPLCQGERHFYSLKKLNNNFTSFYLEFFALLQEEVLFFHTMKTQVTFFLLSVIQKKTVVFSLLKHSKMFVCSEKWPRATFLTVPSGKPEGWIASLLPHINSREKNICGNQVLRESGSFSFLLHPRNNSSSSPAANSPGSWISTGSAEITAQFSKNIFFCWEPHKSLVFCCRFAKTTYLYIFLVHCKPCAPAIASQIFYLVLGLA